ncbi:PP2A regulatory subunit [Musa troglodytarum]|uniref:PP2A regulatory subunit n=1 Tax=Musa troglodytarum TaxID=320322 RepID=A0A9E7FLF8_9LILI|nr:PP2A regulatory subunit [Musa troglodytarum]
MEGMPLPMLFEEASKIHSMASESSVDQEVLRKGIQALLRFCDEMISKLGLFSSNETKDDVSTAKLKYLLLSVPFSLSLKRSWNLLVKEVLTLNQLKGQKRLFVSNAREVQKQSCKKLKKKKRGAWLTSISLSVFKAFDLLYMLKKEEEMFIAVKEKQSKGGEDFACEILDERTKQAEAWQRDASSRAAFLKPAEPITCATFAQDVIEGREKLSQAHEHKHQPQRALLITNHEYRRSWITRNGNDAKMAAEKRQAHGGSKTLHDENAEVEKARAWDDRKDDHPRGAGNKKLAPCG